MNWQAVLTSMLPEHLLLAGIVLLIVLDLVSDRPRGALAVAFVAVAAAAVAALTLALDGYMAAPFAGQFSVNPPP
jgi:NADH-quinone oxidoreductase subunit N